MNSYFCKGDNYLLEITDTSGSHNFPEMTELAIIEGDVFLLVFSVDDNVTFDRVVQIRKQIMELRGEDTPIVVCGNKTDVHNRDSELSEPMTEAIVCIDWESRYHELTAMDHTMCCNVINDALRTFPTEDGKKVNIHHATVIDSPDCKSKRRRSDRIRASIAAFWKRLH